MTDVAVIGMSCRFPGAPSVSDYRSMLRDGRSAIRSLGDAEIRAAGVPSSVLRDPRYVKRAAPLSRMDEFDTQLFGIRPEEAACMDPQQYHLLECVYEAMEAACCQPHDDQCRVGLFVGADQSFYAARRIPDEVLWDPMGRWGEIIANDSHFLATSIAYRLGFTGPAVEVQSACSTSLVAVHLAIQSLLGGDCDAAIAGGVSIRGPQTRGYLYRDGSILSRTGTCRPFDKDADGTVLSSGVGVVVLQRLEDALARAYPVWAVLKGSAVNNDGHVRLAYTAPNEEGQAAVVREAISVSQVDPRTIGYVETHGTGTRLGDLIEYRALTSAFDARRSDASRCRIGSVKSNFGHLESAAGVAGLIKAILSVKHGEIYPTLNFKRPNPEIPFNAGPFVVATSFESLERLDAPRRAGVSSFGIGGTNCHVVLEEPPRCAPGPSTHDCQWQVLGVSAATPSALRRHAQEVIQAVTRLPKQEIADGCFSMLACREARPYRVAHVLATGKDIHGRIPREPREWRFVGNPDEQVTGVVFVLPSIPFAPSVVLPRLLESELSHVVEGQQSLIQHAQTMDLDVPEEHLLNTALSSFAVAIWLVQRGVRPVEIVGPLAPQLSALVAGECDFASALKRCVRNTSTQHTCLAAQDGSDSRLVVDLLRCTPRQGRDIGISVISAIDLGSSVPIDLQLRTCLAELWARGISVDWRAVFGAARRRLPLPTYPFDRHPAWSPPACLARTTCDSSDALPPKDDRRGILARLWHGVLGAEPTPRDRFLDSGGDSLMAVQFAARISDALGTHVAASAILEAPTFDALVDSLESMSVEHDQREYLLSPNQAAVWCMHERDAASAAYNVQAAFKITGDLRPPLLRSSFDLLIQRHEALRLVFSERDGQPRQRVTPPQPLKQWRFLENVDDSQVGDLLVEHGRAPLDLQQPPLLSILLLKTRPAEFVLSVVSHHIVSDEWSAQLMLGEVLRTYRALVTGGSRLVSAQPTAFAREAERIRQRLVSADAYDNFAYWRKALAVVVPLDLPYDRARSAIREYRGSVVPFYLPSDAVSRTRSLGQQANCTPFMVLASVFNILLHCYSGEEDICIGTNFAGRDTGGTADVVGLFTNTVPLRNKIGRSLPFTDLLTQVRGTVLEAQDHQVPLASLVEYLEPPRLSGRNPLFDSTFVLQNVPRHAVPLEGLHVAPIPVHNGTCKFDLELCISETADGGLTGHWEYDCQLFDRRTIEGLDTSFHRILESALDEPSRCVSRLALLSESERRTAICRAAGSKLKVPRQSPWDCFKQQADSNPESIAVLGASGDPWTYQELLSRASALAEKLTLAGGAPGVLFGLLCDRTEQYVVACLAVQACGSAFVPLDTSLPDVRLAEMIAGSQVHAIVLEDRYRRSVVEDLAPLAQRDVSWITVDSDEVSLPTVPPILSSPDLAYVIYTSGSTGRPKGAMVGKCGMANHLWAKVHSLALDSAAVVAQTAPVCFDISVWQIVAPLMVGGRVVMIPDPEVMDVMGLLSRVDHNGVTVLEMVPSYLDIFIQALEQSQSPLPSLKWLMATGEQLPVETCRRWFSACRGARLMNAYGPTECSDDVAQHVLTDPPPGNAVRVPIGRAIPNVAVHVLDDHLEPVPAGVPGEICVTGVCVGQGYLNDDERTAEVFTADPFTEERGSVMYRTGDIGLRRADGSLEYIGRRDQQLKVRGVRIEVEEVESVLRGCTGVEQIAIGQSPERDSLVGLVQLSRGCDSETGLRELRRYAIETLPSYMIPSVFTVVEEIPRGTSGKIDRIAVDSLVCKMRPVAACAAPRVEATSGFALMQRIWCDVLNLASVAPEADFFDLGGDSLKAMRVASLAQSEGLAVSTQDVFRGRTLRSVWALCQESGEVLHDD